jgi:hypothetical protein
VFPIIGASFGPICGAMMVDYLLNGKKWSGPRAGFNPAGWVAWAAGFVVGILPNLHSWKPDVFPTVPAAPVLAFVVGAVVYFLCAKMGMLSPVVPVGGAVAMNNEESRKVILTATSLRAQKQYDQCIKLMLDNLPQIDPDVRMNAWMEIFGAAKEKGDSELARRAAREIARDDPGLPSVQDYL